MSEHALRAGPGTPARDGETNTDGAVGSPASRQGRPGAGVDGRAGARDPALQRASGVPPHPGSRGSDRPGDAPSAPPALGPSAVSGRDVSAPGAVEARALSSSEPDDLQYLIHHAELPATRFSVVVDGALARLGSAMSWLWLVLMAVIVANVILKNAFGDGRIEFEEIQWHIYSALFMLGLSVTLVADDHVRVDVLHERFGLRTKAWVDLLGIVFLLLPFLAMLMWYGLPFVSDSFVTGERSSAPAGLPYRWLIKGALVAGCLLLALAALSRLTRILAYLWPARRPAAARGD